MELLKNLEGLSADEQMSAVVELQKAAMKHLEEQKQASIGKSAEMVILGLKKIKSDFEAKFDSLNYDIQTKIANLKDGEQGLQGPKGEQGDRGLDGAQGKDGKSGVDGKDGLDGKDGVSVQDAKIDFDGSLVITLSDGREINVGEVVPVDVAQTIHKIQSGSGGDSQTTLNAITALQATIATYGTMALQNKTSVDIEGGTIDNTTIGATTPNTGVFTTLTATGQTDLGGPVGNPVLKVFGSTPIQFIDVEGSTTGTTRLRSWSTNASSSSLLFQTRATGNFTFATGGSPGNVQAFIAHTTSAVNYVQVTGAATGGRSVISAQGSDTNTGLSFTGKGNARIAAFFNNNATSSFHFSVGVGGSTSAVNYLDASGSAAGTGPILSALGSDTNIPLVLQPKGTGALQAQQTDSTATGGNARGANAVDWQTSRSSASQVASGTQSFIGAGTRNTSSNFYTGVVAGYTNTASGFSSFIGSGNQHITSGTYSSITSGFSNVASNTYTSVVNGNSNTAAGYYNFIGNGYFNSGTSASAVTTQSATMNGTTAVTLSGSNASIKVGQYITGTSIAGDTYVAAISGTSLTLSQAASGSGTATLSFFTPHGVVVGGGNNQATGSYSFIGGGGDAGTAANRNVASGDWSTVAGGQKNVASANYAAIAGGTNNTASGVGAFIGGGGFDGATISANTVSGLSAVVSGGMGNSASGYNAVVSGGRQNLANSTAGTVNGGGYGTSRGITGYTVSPASFSPIGTFLVGTSQAALLVLGKQTTDATATVITSDGSAASGTNQVILPPNSAYAFRGTVIANVTGGGNTKAWAIEGAIKRGANAASTALVGTPTVVSGFADVGAATWAIAVTADTTNGGLAVTFTGQAATTIRCVAKLETTEVTF